MAAPFVGVDLALEAMDEADLRAEVLDQHRQIEQHREVARSAAAAAQLIAVEGFEDDEAARFSARTSSRWTAFRIASAMANGRW